MKKIFILLIPFILVSCNCRDAVVKTNELRLIEAVITQLYPPIPPPKPPEPKYANFPEEDYTYEKEHLGSETTEILHQILDSNGKNFDTLDIIINSNINEETKSKFFKEFPELKNKFPSNINEVNEAQIKDILTDPSIDTETKAAFIKSLSKLEKQDNSNTPGTTKINIPGMGEVEVKNLKPGYPGFWD